LDKLNILDSARNAYESATKIKPSDPNAWQGLIKLYERQGSQDIPAYQNAVLRLAEIHRDADDKYKCQDVVDKFIAFVKSQGSRNQQKDALQILLPLV